MNVFGVIGRMFSALGHAAMAALRSAEVRGLTAAVLATALQVAREAAAQVVDSAERREWAVQKLISRTRVPESIARLAVELAVQRLKAEAR